MISFKRVLILIVLNVPLIACAKENNNCDENAECYYELAQKEYNENNGYNIDVINNLKKSANLGLDIAQYKLGLIYSDKQLKFYDYDKSKFWLRKQSLRNYDAAYFLAQLIFEKGRLSRSDYEEIEEKLKYATNGNNLDASRDLAMLYFYAPEINKDLDKVYKYSSLAAEKNIPEAQYILGTLYDFGEGPVKQDYKQAFYWYSLASQKNNKSALNNLGVLYAKGQGVSKDEKKAIKYFEDASNLGDTGAMLNLGEIYLKGLGTKQDIPLAKLYFNEALKKGDLKAKEYLSRIEE